MTLCINHDFCTNRAVNETAGYQPSADKELTGALGRRCRRRAQFAVAAAGLARGKLA